MKIEPARIHRIVSGQDRSPLAMLLRAATATVEPGYTLLVRLRNRSFDNRRRSAHDLGRPTISVGNITTGGTGKTPVVRWLAEQLRARGRRPAVLMRGYRANAAGISDEQQLLERSLNPASHPMQPIPVIANPNRVAGAATALRAEPAVDTFILDDAFQHRQVSRQFDLVLINAADPFGGGRVLPRGLLREPLDGLARASAFLVTRASSASPTTLAEIKTQLAVHNRTAPIYQCDHVQTGLTRWPGGASLRMHSLIDSPIFAFCGLGDPLSFARQLEQSGGRLVGRRWFADHHIYSVQDLRHLQQKAANAGALRLVTTAKDWTKIAPFAAELNPLPLLVVDVAVEFDPGDDQRLLAQIEQRFQKSG
jgi:tetraacyldisaccharide 4'-kinase